MPELLTFGRELWREEAKLDSVLSNASQEVDRAERGLSQMMDHNTSRGIAAVRRIKRHYNLDGVYGTLAELFDVNDKYRTAVEVTAGQSLFHYVVDTDDTATRVLEILQNEKSGRVTFMPLNRLRSRPVNMPKASDTIPMIEKLQYDSAYEKAFAHVFGKTIICPNLQVASQYARSHGVNAITPEGDRSDKKGALSGGFHDSRMSRLDGVKKVAKWRDEYETKKNRGTEIRREIETLDQVITRAVGELQKLEQQRHQVQNSSGPLRHELKSKRDHLQKKNDNLDAKQRAFRNIETNLASLNDQINAFEAELSSPFQKALTNEEENRLETLNTAAQDLRRRYQELSSERSELEARKSVLEVELRENLNPHLDQLVGQDQDLAEDDTQGNLKQTQREMKRLRKGLENLNDRLQKVDDSIEQANSRVNELGQQNAETRRELEELAKSFEKHQRRMEKSMQKKAALTKQAAECTGNIRDLGVLPDEAFTKYKNTDSNSVVKKLHKVNEALKKYSHVNKKAFEQYNSFTKQRETLTSRSEELDASQKSINDLISVLDQRKDEAIERTFKQVSREFANVFEKLVPAGRGRLIIQRKTDRDLRQDNDLDSEDEEARQSVENYVGVGISVSFNSKHDEQQRIQQLSGGQKSMHFPLRCMCLANQTRSLRACIGLCHPSLRSGAILPIRRDRRQPRCAVPDGSCTDAQVDFGLDERAVYLYHVPSRDAACCREVLRCQLPTQGQHDRCRVSGRGAEVCRRAEGVVVEQCSVYEFYRVMDGRRNMELSLELFNLRLLDLFIIALTSFRFPVNEIVVRIYNPVIYIRVHRTCHKYLILVKV